MLHIKLFVGYSKAPEQPQSSARPICQSRTITSMVWEPATICIAAYWSSTLYALQHGRRHLSVQGKFYYINVTLHVLQTLPFCRQNDHQCKHWSNLRFCIRYSIIYYIWVTDTLRMWSLPGTSTYDQPWEWSPRWSDLKFCALLSWLSPIPCCNLVNATQIAAY